MAKRKNQKKSVLGLVLALIAVVFGSLLFVMAVGGWFDGGKIVIDEEYRSDKAEYMELSKDTYEDLINNKKSFVILVDQGGCTTADRLRGFVEDFMNEAGVKVYRMMFSEMKESSLHSHVKYYPSVVLIDKGKVRTFLRADSDEDADEYNDYDVFIEWMKENVVF